MIINTNPEFGIELTLVIPYAYHLHKEGKLEKVITSKGMKPFYYFCDDVEEKYDFRTIDNLSAGLGSLPNPWIYGNKKNAELYKDEWEYWESFRDVEKGCGILNYEKWNLPDYKSKYKNDEFVFEKPFIVVSNRYNWEHGQPPIGHFSIKCLYEIFNYLTEKGYNVIYKRPDNTEFAPDQNEIATLQGGYEFIEITDQGVLSDYGLCEYYDNVYNINDFDHGDEFSYNEFQLECFSGADGFITTNGGGGILCAYFGKPVLFYVPHGKELREGYLTKENSYIKKLSNADIHVVFDEGDINDYSELINKMKEVF